MELLDIRILLFTIMIFLVIGVGLILNEVEENKKAIDRLEQTSQEILEYSKRPSEGK